MFRENTSGPGTGVFNQHNRNTVPNLIEDPTGFTDQTAPIICEFNLTLTFGAGKKVKPFGIHIGSLLLLVR
jgi:hypothetical protein